MREDASASTRSVWIALRFAMAALFLWAFADKTFGLGFATKPEQAWLAGGSPTLGYLKGSVGPLAGFYQAIAGAAATDWAFMLGLLLVGGALLLGVGLRIAAVGGAAMMLLMWSTRLPPAANPVLDAHIVQAVVFLGIGFARPGEVLGLGRAWAKLPVVRRHPVLA